MEKDVARLEALKLALEVVIRQSDHSHDEHIKLILSAARKFSAFLIDAKEGPGEVQAFDADGQSV